jgi:two-component system sensor histidine kinase CpxA
MGSLFTKIFMAFWLTAILLGAAFYLAARSLGDRELEAAETRLAAHGETAANLYREQGLAAVSHWIHSLHGEGEPRMHLLDETGRPPFMQRIPPKLERRLRDMPLKRGTYRLFPGHYLILVPINEQAPRYFLVTVAELGRLHGLSTWSRIIIALFVSGLISLGLASIITRPIRRLRRAAQSMAEGNLSVRVGGKGRDEVAELARDFDIMAERLAEMLQSQRRLLSDVSHELRSPLARLRVALELMEKSGTREKARQRIEKEADELERLVSALLSLARLESGQFTLERKTVDLTPLLQAIVNDADFEAEAKSRHVTLNIQQSLAVEGDPVLLRSAVENVVRNAIRHTREHSTVTVSLSNRDNTALIEVCDAGDGVPEAELPRMFEAFTRIGEARDRHSGGFGLGLSITGQVVSAHGGQVSARNRESGGLCVTLILPCTPSTRP